MVEVMKGTDDTFGTLACLAVDFGLRCRDGPDRLQTPVKKGRWGVDGGAKIIPISKRLVKWGSQLTDTAGRARIL